MISTKQAKIYTSYTFTLIIEQNLETYMRYWEHTEKKWT